MRNGLLAFATALWLSGANAARACGNTATPSTYQWSVGAARYDGAVSGDTAESTATVAISIVPGNRPMGTFFECVAEWPVSWAGWYEYGDKIIWSDCIWAGNGLTYDTTVSFALDWKNRTMYVSHTFACSDIEIPDALATGSIHIDMDCATDDEGSETCILKGASDGSSLTVSTQGGPARVEAGSTCTDNSERYQSWQLENWLRQYERDPGSSSTLSDTGPSFTLRNMANTDVFDCTTSGNENNTFDGTCTPVAEESSTTATATFSFDPQLDMLIVTQSWDCGDSSSFDAIGVGFVQATCSREGNVFTCTSSPIWVGTKTV
ncbi:hypothetical protein F4779DRAFT_284989 [Xylariaceae sp. FL0662B]|nr:hypothetical protein F4779DRAFT_284989 [Xylariaceae sp. FL0662B]